MAIYDGAPPVFKTLVPPPILKLKLGKKRPKKLAQTAIKENPPMSAKLEIPKFPYENRKMSVEEMNKQLESQCRCLVSPNQISQNLGLGKDGQPLPTPIRKDGR